jgi:hypothetical protein
MDMQDLTPCLSRPIVALFAVVVTVLLVFLHWYVGPTKPSEKMDLVLALAQILAGSALLSGLYFTWRTLQVNREGQITDRFTRAIDQLGKTDDHGNKLFEIHRTMAHITYRYLTGTTRPSENSAYCAVL